MSYRPPTPDELLAIVELERVWAQIVAEGRAREANYEAMAAERGLYTWHAYWGPADARWWDHDNPGPSRGANGITAEADGHQLAWGVPQAGEDALLVVARPDETRPVRAGPADGLSSTGFDAVFGTERGARRGLMSELRALLPWLGSLDAERMAGLHTAPGSEAQSFNVRGIHVMNDERDHWFAYEVYPPTERRWRRNILALIELDPAVIYVRPPTDLQRTEAGSSAGAP